MNNNIALNPNVTNIKQCKKKKKHTDGGGGKIDAKIPAPDGGGGDFLEPKRSAADEEETNCFLFSIAYGFFFNLRRQPNKKPKKKLSQEKYPIEERRDKILAAKFRKQQSRN